MIRTSKQLKDKVRNLSGSDSTKAQTYIRNFIMERFLERMSLSAYRDRFILKGGMLVASVVGLDTRATMDIDATVVNLSLSEENAVNIVREIISVPLPDGVEFRIIKTAGIMEDLAYPGVRIVLEASLDRLRQTIKIDISTGDVITPSAIEYSYPLMLEDRSISIRTYNIETILAEKLETIMQRGLANTRLRDFYDIYILQQQTPVDPTVFAAAFQAILAARGTINQFSGLPSVLDELETSPAMQNLWARYQANSFYVGDISWHEVLASVKTLADAAARELPGAF